jgi:hypothetical protein
VAGAGGAAVDAAAGPLAATTGRPHSLQNFAFASSSLPHPAHVEGRRAPHSAQNFAVAGLSRPQEMQRLTR